MARLHLSYARLATTSHSLLFSIIVFDVSLASSKNRKEREKQSALLLMLLMLIDLKQINYISKITHSCGRHCKVFLTESSE